MTVNIATLQSNGKNAWAPTTLSEEVDRLSKVRGLYGKTHYYDCPVSLNYKAMKKMAEFTKNTWVSDIIQGKRWEAG